mgnify:CR=1 FL=1
MVGTPPRGLLKKPSAPEQMGELISWEVNPTEVQRLLVLLHLDRAVNPAQESAHADRHAS